MGCLWISGYNSDLWLVLNPGWFRQGTRINRYWRTQCCQRVALRFTGRWFGIKVLGTCVARRSMHNFLRVHMSCVNRKGDSKNDTLWKICMWASSTAVPNKFIIWKVDACKWQQWAFESPLSQSTTSPVAPTRSSDPSRSAYLLSTCVVTLWLITVGKVLLCHKKPIHKPI